jgi:hypothetical protein
VLPKKIGFIFNAASWSYEGFTKEKKARLSAQAVAIRATGINSFLELFMLKKLERLEFKRC